MPCFLAQELMKRNRIILLIAMISSLIFTSFVGGPLSYALLYTIFLLPVVSFFYMLYVYFRFKVYQSIEGSSVVKGEGINYKYNLTNEDFIYYKGFKISFLLDYSKVIVENFQEEVSLHPGDQHERSGQLTCLYRGDYKVGIESIVIKDLLGLFSMTMDKPSTISARVYPLIVQSPTLSALDFDEDSKTVPFSSTLQKELLDNEMSKYTQGDEPKRVNWKVSAKQNELYVRNYTDNPKEKMLVFLDTLSIIEQIGDRIILEDALLETTLAILNYYTKKNIPSDILYFTDRLHQFNIQSLEDFSHFYNTTALMMFDGKHPLGDLIHSTSANFSNYKKVVAITGVIDESLINSLSMPTGITTCIILVGDREKTHLQDIKNQLGKIHLIHIPKSSEILNVLG
jgi:hypothetical protein